MSWLLLPEAMGDSRTVKDCHGKAKELERKGWRMRVVPRGFENLQHILGNIEGHMHAQAFVHAQERPEKAVEGDLKGYIDSQQDTQHILMKLLKNPRQRILKTSRD